MSLTLAVVVELRATASSTTSPRSGCSTTAGSGSSRSRFALLFSGFIIPLPFFPDWLEAVARVLPFAAIVQIPVDVFLEQVSGAEIAVSLVFQAAWAAILLGLAQFVLGSAIRRVVIQGG